MANRYATKTGNWSDPTVWDGGTLPGPDDVVRPSGKIVTIDQDITVTGLMNNTTAPAVTGGYFVVATIATVRNITLSGQPRLASALGLITISAPSGTLNLVGSIHASNLSGGSGLLISGTCTVNLTGDLTGGDYSTGTAATVTGAATVNILGNVSASITSSGICGSGMLIQAPATVTVNGNVQGSPSAAVNNTPGISITSVAVVTVTGSVTGGASAANYGIYISAAGATITAGSAIATTSIAIYANQVCTITVHGEVRASNTVAAIYTDILNTVIRVGGPIVFAANNQNPIYALSFMVKASQNLAMTFRDDSASPDGGAAVECTNYVTNSPDPADVRQATTYGPSGALTGTLAVPSVVDVAHRVAVDNTTGTAALDLSTLADLVGAQIAAAMV